MHYLSTCMLRDRIRGTHGNPTKPLLSIYVPLDPHVPAFAPIRPPRVFEQPVLGPFHRRAVPNYSHGMVYVRPAPAVARQDAAGVKLKRVAVRIYANRNGLAGDGLEKCGFAVPRNVLVTRDRGGVEIRLLDPLGLAGVDFALVGVLGLGGDAFVLDDELECMIHPPSIAAIVTVLGVAVDELLFGEGDEVAGVELVNAFHCGYC